ncbi:unnamed protein product, partial [Phaeothamnion confervicola]
GAGHLGRCLALAEAYFASGWRVEFVLTGDAFAHLLGSNCTWRVAKPDQTLDVVGQSAPDGCDVLVIDDYERGELFETELRGIARCIVVLDDQTGRRHHCDLLIDAAVYVADAYRNLAGDSAQFLVGPKYALVRSDILAHRRRAMEQRRDRDVTNILLTFGATDPAGLTLKLIEAVDKAFPERTITIALSSRARDIEALRSRIAGSHRIRLL